MKKNILIIVVIIVIVLIGVSLSMLLMRKSDGLKQVEFDGQTYEYNDYNKTNSSLGGELAIP